MSLLRIVLHIGGSKTASTSLQRGPFLHAPDVHHFGEYGDGVTTIAEEVVVRSVLEVDDAFFDLDAARALFDRHAGLAGTGILVFSSADVPHGNQPTLAAHRLRALVGSDVTVVLVVRNQVHALASYYAGHGAWLKPAPRPYFRAHVTLDDWLDHQWLMLPDSRLRTFSYWEQLAPFIEVFGRDRVQVVCFEDLVSGSLEAWGPLSELLNLDAGDALSLFRNEHERERITEGQLRYGRAMRMLLPFVSAPDVRATRGWAGAALQRGNKFVPRWRIDQLERLAAYYGFGNAQLELAFGLRLGRFGYPG